MQAQEQGDAQDHEETQQLLADIPADAQASEDQQAVEQWLRRIPDDPGGLLRRKFQRQYEREQTQGRRSEVPQAW